ncbi:MAG: maltose ABC transporter substrate-binding protein [Chloroflexi bacterium]|nr:maltose ABC transporter substrate-binding protein [Chloroflexota bacterium]
MSKRIFALALILVIVASLSVSFVSAQDEALVIWADDTRAPVLEEVAAAFTEEFGIPVEVVQVGFGDIRTNMVTAAPAGEGPDLFIGAHDWIGELNSNNLLAAIELDEELAAEFSPISLQAFTIDGVLYALPYAVENVALFRNTDLVADAPATWEEVREISQEIIESGAAQYGFVYQRGDPYHFFGIQTAFGGYVFGQDENGNYLADDLGIDSPGSIAALQFVTDMVADGIVPSTSGDEATALFESGDAAMYISGPWFLQRFRDAGVPFAVSPIPAGPDGTPGRPFLGVQGFMVNNLSEQVDLAVAFLTEFVATEETMIALQTAGGRPAAFMSAAAASDDPDFPGFAEAGAVGLPMPAIPEMGQVWGAWGNGITLAIQGDATAEEAFTAAGEEIRALIAATPEPTP